MQTLFKRQNFLFLHRIAHHSMAIRLLFAITSGLFLLMLMNLTGCAQSVNTHFGTHPQTCELEKSSPAICSPSSSALAYFNDLLLKEMQDLYAIPNRELSQEIINLESQNNLHSKFKLALLLTRTQQAPNTERALVLLEELQAQAQTQDFNSTWYMWAKLLYPIIAEQHALNVRLAQQNRLLRENIKQIEDLKQKLSDLRAIEQSLRTRPE